MRRMTAVWMVLLSILLVLSLTSGAAFGADADTPEAIKARAAEALKKMAEKTSPRVLVIPIREEIDLSTAVYVERAMTDLATQGIDLVVVEVDTYGGRIDAMVRIVRVFLASLEEQGVPVVAFINEKAISAGSIISVSCDRIYIASGGKIGAAAVVASGPQGPINLPESIEEKYTSFARAQARAGAQAKGYPPAIAEAWVDRQKEVIEYEIDGKREFFSEDDYDRRRSDLELDELAFAEAEKRMREIRVISRKGELLTMTHQEAIEVGLATAVVNSRAELWKALGIESPEVIEAAHNWSEYVFGWLASPGVKGLLLMLGLLGLYIEFKIPGFGLPGFFGLTCLVLFFFSQYFMGIAGYTGVIVFLVGVVLVLIEVFVIPGFGVTGVTGIILMLAGIFLSMQDFVIPDFEKPWDIDLFRTNVIVMSLAVVGSAILMWIIARFLPKTPFFGRIILASTGPAGELKASATIAPTGVVEPGAAGEITTACRPAGRARFGEKFLDVVAEGQFIEPGSSVEVIKVEGNRIVVKKVD